MTTKRPNGKKVAKSGRRRIFSPLPTAEEMELIERYHSKINSEFRVSLGVVYHAAAMKTIRAELGGQPQ